MGVVNHNYTSRWFNMQ